MLQYVEFKVESTFSLHFLMLQNTSLNMATSRTGVRSNPLTLSRNLNITIISKVAGVLNVLCNKIAEQLDIPVRNVTEKMLVWSDAIETVSKATVNYINSTHMCNKFSKILTFEFCCCKEFFSA
jgi:hypothetical protein